MNFKKLFMICFLCLIIWRCSSVAVTPEPTIDQISIQSEPICIVFSLNPFCYRGKSNSLYVTGIMENKSLKKFIYLEYFLDSYDVGLPVGVSLKLDNDYYKLKKVATDYTSTLKITSEMSQQVVDKILSANVIMVSYSNNSETKNIELSSGERKDLAKQIKEVQEKLNAQVKMRIIKP
ncbi:MAG: hypothetical protein H7A23_08715 [Leptospiraceae bacterium]|nr:hypothetical protein [Leptospiraceae bacterium]MCP5494627.1 hypothetical protein [Leptospiraceae bacterium]